MLGGSGGWAPQLKSLAEHDARPVSVCTVALDIAGEREWGSNGLAICQSEPPPDGTPHQYQPGRRDLITESFLWVPIALGRGQKLRG